MPKTKPVNGQVSPTDSINFAKWVRQFVEVRDRKAEFEEKVKEHRKEYLDVLSALEGQILAALDATGQESARTEFGTATSLYTDSASCTDPDAFVDFVRKHDAYELMERRASKVACRAFLEEHGELPPGVKLNTVRSVGVRRPT